jgi:formylglycine-generating enzyme required for sulfatase activity
MDEHSDVAEFPAEPVDQLAALCAAHAPVDCAGRFVTGTVFGDWRLTAFIGRGGNGEVYCARHVRLDISAAVKVLMRDDERAKSRFMHEAQMLAVMRSKAFPRFFAYGEANEHAYIALELLEPCELPMGDRAVAKFMLKVCGAVAELHALGYVHRDIKPSNILFRMKGPCGAQDHECASEPVLADLGLVKQIPYPDSKLQASDTGVQTIGGVGTPGYGAPEQMERGEVSAAVDVHALGVLADQCFKGRPPRRWGRIIQVATSSIPARRYATVQAFARAIRMRNLWRWAVAAMVVACVAAACVLVSLAMRPDKYCVVDLSGGPDAKAYPVAYLKTEPSGWTKERGWPDEYKTSKLVRRLIKRGSFVMGVADDSDESRRRRVEFDKTFYMGVFEVTQRQYELVTGENPSNAKGAMRPVENISWTSLRGWWESYDWPEKKGVHANTFLGRLCSRTGLHFDLPAETQWEYACRAGTASIYNDGGSSVADLRRLGRFAFNQKLRGWGETNEGFVRHVPDGRGGYMEKHTVVGSYSPNAWGLYDMHGNVSEWCLDRWKNMSRHTDICAAAENGENRVRRGGSWNSTPGFCRSFCRDISPAPMRDENFGFRVVMSR